MARKKDKIDWDVEDIVEKYFNPLVEEGEYDLNNAEDFEKFMRTVLLAQQNGEI